MWLLLYLMVCILQVPMHIVQFKTLFSSTIVSLDYRYYYCHHSNHCPHSYHCHQSHHWERTLITSTEKTRIWEHHFYPTLWIMIMIDINYYDDLYTKVRRTVSCSSVISHCTLWTRTEEFSYKLCYQFHFSFFFI